MIRTTLPEFESRIIYAGLVDYPYNNRKWIYQVNNKIVCYMQDKHLGDKVVLVGHDKDSSSWYLKAFPQYSVINCENHDNINATDIRRYWWLGTEVGEVRPLVPEGTFRIMESTGNELLYLTKEAEVIEQYKKSWSNSPFPPTLVCVDAVVFSAGQVLMVRRAQAPGKDLWALPGGFVDGRETLYEAVLRELLEETGLDLSKYKALVSKTFDHPDRGERGRTFTKAFKFEIPVDPILDKKTDGEASEIEWFPLNSINEMNTEIYQDHQNIIQYFNNNYNEVVDESHFGY
jgi:bifunctional NMN adenylyltransferase/nudix hydrolase